MKAPLPCLIRCESNIAECVLLNGGVELGRVTESFRIMFQEEVESLKKTYCQALMDSKHREAFDMLGKAWTQEVGAMSYSKVPTVLDIMLLTAIIDNRKNIGGLLEEVQGLKASIEEVRKMAKELKVPVQEAETAMYEEEYPEDYEVDSRGP